VRYTSFDPPKALPRPELELWRRIPTVIKIAETI